MPPKVTERMRRIMPLLACLTVLAISMTCVPGFGDDEIVKTTPGVENPHNREGRCHVCHVASERDLNSWFTFGWNKRKMKLDYNQTCIQCHSVRLGHGLGKVPDFDHNHLPFDTEGKITCAITCHNMHIDEGDGEQLRFHLRWPIDTLCRSCHWG